MPHNPPSPAPLPEGIIEIPPGQSRDFACECGSLIFESVAFFGVVYDVLDVSIAGGVPRGAVLRCRKCHRDFALDAAGYARIRAFHERQAQRRLRGLLPPEPPR